MMNMLRQHWSEQVALARRHSYDDDVNTANCSRHDYESYAEAPEVAEASSGASWLGLDSSVTVSSRQLGQMEARIVAYEKKLADLTQEAKQLRAQLEFLKSGMV